MENRKLLILICISSSKCADWNSKSVCLLYFIEVGSVEMPPLTLCAKLLDFSFFFFLSSLPSSILVQMNNLLLHWHTHTHTHTYTLTHEQRILYYWKGPVITLIAILGCLIIYFSYPHFYLAPLSPFQHKHTSHLWARVLFVSFSHSSKLQISALFSSLLASFQASVNIGHENCLFTLLPLYCQVSSSSLFLFLLLLVFLLPLLSLSLSLSLACFVMLAQHFTLV